MGCVVVDGWTNFYQDRKKKNKYFITFKDSIIEPDTANFDDGKLLNIYGDIVSKNQVSFIEKWSENYQMFYENTTLFI